MLLGQSLFQSVMTRLAEEAAAREEDACHDDAVASRARGLRGDLLGGLERDSDVTGYHGARLYLDMIDEAPPSAEPPAKVPAIPAHLERLSDAEIAEDLGIQPGDTPARLAERRRAFARLNHPDRLPSEYRRQATLRMTAANALVDAALRDAERRQS